MIQSWYDKKLNDLGNLFVVDDGSILRDELIFMLSKYNVNYFSATNTPDTKNGLAYSLSDWMCSWPRFCCVDDAVFGKGIKDRLIYLFEEELPRLNKWGIIGTFACYEDITRSSNKVIGASLWEVPNSILYALVGHIFSQDFSKIVTQRWNDVNAGIEEYPAMCDDIWIKKLLKEFDYKAYNTMQDFTQHTGMDNRTFGESGSNSEYYSKVFVGE